MINRDLLQQIVTHLGKMLYSWGLSTMNPSSCEKNYRNKMNLEISSCCSVWISTISKTCCFFLCMLEKSLTHNVTVPASVMKRAFCHFPWMVAKMKLRGNAGCSGVNVRQDTDSNLIKSKCPALTIMYPAYVRQWVCCFNVFLIWGENCLLHWTCGRILQSVLLQHVL